jgi:hypothetical protein
MRSLLVAVACVAFLACGGNVVVDQPSGASTSAGSTSGAGAGGTGGTTGTGIGIGGSTTFPGTGGGPSTACAIPFANPCSGTCSGALSAGAPPCSTETTAVSDYCALIACTANFCAAPCAAFEQGMASVEGACGACLMSDCAPTLTACATN